MKREEIQGDEVWDVVCVCGHPRSRHHIGICIEVAKKCEYGGLECDCGEFEPRTVFEGWQEFDRLIGGR